MIAAVAPGTRRVLAPSWSADVFGRSMAEYDAHTYHVALGGRGPGKTTTFAQRLAMIGASRYESAHICREYHNTTDVSTRRAVKEAVDDLDLGDWWHVGASGAECATTGSTIEFHGISRNPESIQGWQGATLLWVEEATPITEAVWDVLLPTVGRRRGAHVWVSFNPRDAEDWVWQRFVVNREPTDMVRLVNFDESPWFPGTDNERQLIADYRTRPKIARWKWAGQLRTDTGRWLDENDIDRCVEPVGDPSPAVGQAVGIGIDAAHISDFWSVCLAWYRTDGRIALRWLTFTNREAVKADRTGRYARWEAEGVLIVAGERATDGNEVRRRLIEIVRSQQLCVLVNDPKETRDLAAELQAWGVKHMGGLEGRAYEGPVRRFEALLKNRELAIDADPCARWQLLNASLKADSEGRHRPVKWNKTSRPHIDACDTALMAIHALAEHGSNG